MAATLRVSCPSVPGGRGDDAACPSLPCSAPTVPRLPTDSNLRLFVSRDGSTTLSGIQLANR